MMVWLRAQVCAAVMKLLIRTHEPMPNDEAAPNLDEIAAVLGRTPSGLFILTAGDGNGAETGMLASWVQQSGFDPPSVSVAVNRKRYLNDWLAKSPRVVLNLVGESQKQYLGHFGRGFDPGQPAFEELDVARSPCGLPILADALGWMEGEVSAQAEAGDHIVYIVRIETAGAGPALETEKPWVHIRKNGLGY